MGAKCSHEDAPELSLPPYRSSYRFVNTMINKGDSYENINDMATMFAKMMHEMKNRNSNYQVNSYSRHGDNKMDKMRMMMKMMKVSNMMNDHSSSSYRSDDNDMYDMFSEMFDSSSDRMDNYRSPDYSNQMGRMSHFKNMFNNMRYKRAAGDNLDLGDRLVEKLAEQKHQMEAKIGNMTCVMKELNVLDASNNIDIQAMKRISRSTRCPASGSRTSTSTCLTPATRWPPTCPLTSPRTPLSLVTPSALSSSARSRCSPSAPRRPRPSCACTRTSEEGLVQLRPHGGHPPGDPVDRARVLPPGDAAAARQGDGLHDRWHVRSSTSTGATWPGAGLLRCWLSHRLQLPTVFHARAKLAKSFYARFKSILTKTNL